MEKNSEYLSVKKAQSIIENWLTAEESQEVLKKYLDLKNNVLKASREALVMLATALNTTSDWLINVLKEKSWNDFSYNSSQEKPVIEKLSKNFKFDFEITDGVLSIKNLPEWTRAWVKTDIDYPQNDPKSIPLNNSWELKLVFPNGEIYKSDLSKNPLSFEKQESDNTPLSQELTSLWLLKNWKIYRDTRLASESIDVESAYISWEYALYLINNWKIKQAETVLESAVNSAIKNNGRVSRLYYSDWSSEWEASTNWDASVISIALWKYLEITKNNPTTPFREKAQNANNLIQKEFLWKLKYVEDKAFTVMSDSNPLMDWIETQWTTSCSVENNARRIISLKYNGDIKEWKRQLEKLIETSRDPNTKQFASWIDISKKPPGPTTEYARDAFSLLVIAADTYWIVDKYKQKFIQAANQKPAYSLPDGTFWYSFDHQPWKSSAIPEFMQLDVLALNILWLNDLSKKHQELAFKSHKDLNGRYSTEYSSVDSPNSINLVMIGNTVGRTKSYY